MRFVGLNTSFASTAGDDLIRTKHRRIGNQIFEVKVLMQDVTYVEPIADLTMFRWVKYICQNCKTFTALTERMRDPSRASLAHHWLSQPSTSDLMVQLKCIDCGLEVGLHCRWEPDSHQGSFRGARRLFSIHVSHLTCTLITIHHHLHHWSTTCKQDQIELERSASFQCSMFMFNVLCTVYCGRGCMSLESERGKELA